MTRLSIAISALMIALSGCKSEPKEAENPALDGMQVTAGAGAGGSAGTVAQAGSSAPTAQAGSQANAGSSGSAGSAGTPAMQAGSEAPPIEDGGMPTGPACDDEGEFRCVAQGSMARQRCDNGQLVAADCGDDEVCDTSAGNEGECVALSEQCVGHSDEAICVGADMHFCSVDSTSLRVETCESDRHCQEGLAAEQCALCLPGSYDCDGAQLKRCDDDGMAFTDDSECPSADLCNAISGACTDAACLPGDKTCDGDTLQVCNASQTGFDDDEDCGDGLCDLVGEECDVCVPGTRTCNNAADGSLVCNGDGQGRTEAPCPSEEPKCVGSGTCVECTSPADCETDNPCVTPLCNAGSCGQANALSGTCTLQGGGDGVCDGAGGCVECVSSFFDCGGDRPYCVFNVCRPCFGACSLGDACDRDDDCGSGVCEGGTCRPACTGSCEIGDACAADDDCASDDCSNGTCTKICDDVSISDQSEYDAARDCVEINGNLTISYTAPTTDLSFPELTTITGSVAPTYQGITNNPMQHLHLPALRTIGGGVTLSATNLREVDWPLLESIGGFFNVIAMPQLTYIDLPSLETIGDIAQVMQCSELTSVEMPALRTVDSFGFSSAPKVEHAAFDSIQDVPGSVDVSLMWNLSYNDVRALWEVSDRSFEPIYVGCCLPVSEQAGCDGFDPGLCEP